MGDERKPWTYRGWMLPYVWGLHADPRCSFPNRWGYWLAYPYDHLGEVMAEYKGGSGWNMHAFYPTPMSLCRLMAQMTMGDEPDPRKRTMNDCAMGTGRMQLVASDYCMVLTGQDIDPAVLKIAKINGALYAPWMCWPVPQASLDATPPLAAQEADALVRMFARIRGAVDELAADSGVTLPPLDAIEVAPADTPLAEADEIAPMEPDSSTPPAVCGVNATGESVNEEAPPVNAEPEGPVYNVADHRQGLLFPDLAARPVRRRQRG